MKLSGRLRTITDLVTEGSVVADIGTDHGYVPITLLKEGKAPHAIAVDLSRGALSKAVENAQRAGIIPPDYDPLSMELQDETLPLEFRLSDGLSAIRPGEADCIVISGMGGILMCNILEAGKEIALSAKELILSPHRDVDLVRGFLLEHGFEAEYDEMILDKKKTYTILKGVRR